jgi:hypothetical protein
VDVGGALNASGKIMTKGHLEKPHPSGKITSF